MSKIQNQDILLLGLPGAGKSRVAKALLSQFGCEVLSNEDVQIQNEQIQFTRPGSFEWHDLENLPDLLVTNLNLIKVYCVIDIRSILPAGTLDWTNNLLQKMLNIADGIVFSFSEKSSLNDQTWWNSWLKKQNSNSQIPIIRMLNQTLPNSFNGFEKRAIEQKNIDSSPKDEWVETGQELNKPKPCQKVKCFNFSLEKIMLDHLLMVLDNARQNHGINITRVTGVLNTFEYSNLVQIEGTPYRWDTFAAESEANVGTLTICGTEINPTWLTEMIQACKV